LHQPSIGKRPGGRSTSTFTRKETGSSGTIGQWRMMGRAPAALANAPPLRMNRFDRIVAILKLGGW